MLLCVLHRQARENLSTQCLGLGGRPLAAAFRFYSWVQELLPKPPDESTPLVTQRPLLMVPMRTSWFVMSTRILLTAEA